MSNLALAEDVINVKMADALHSTSCAMVMMIAGMLLTRITTPCAIHRHADLIAHLKSLLVTTENVFLKIMFVTMVIHAATIQMRSAVVSIHFYN